jgi:adenylosuccinate synthase
LGHGSVGVGVGTTMQRSMGPHKLHAVDLLYKPMLDEKLKQIELYHIKEMLYQFNHKEIMEYRQIVNLEFKFWDDSISDMNFQVVSYNYLSEFRNIIFEGAQGILLDMDHGVFPNVTFGNTTSKNAISICKELGIKDIEMYYVTRCYLTRHGNGWMPNDSKIQLINNDDETNVENEWQGKMRVGELDYNLLKYALKVDWAYSYGNVKHLVITCLDQRPDFVLQDIQKPFKSILGSYSNDSKDFRELTFS